MTTKQTIEVEGLPKGWRAVSFRKPLDNETFIGYDGTITSLVNANCVGPRLIVKRIQPLRIVLEETDKGKHDIALYYDAGCWTYWSKVKETGSPLTNDEPKLSLTKRDMIDLIEHIKLGGQMNEKVAEFIKDK